MRKLKRTYLWKWQKKAAEREQNKKRASSPLFSHKKTKLSLCGYWVLALHIHTKIYYYKVQKHHYFIKKFVTSAQLYCYYKTFSFPK